MARLWRLGGVLKLWHVRRDVSRTWETLMVPGNVPGREAKPKGEAIEDHQGVGSAHSSLRSGEPVTWRRG
ncbi:MAG: hypothetical protein GY696_01970 [Gammaproteobacteria bacterium]|nr:hypothetical protein [Gammaproteobacteria bacterium]